MKYSCDIIKDLLPLYIDGACSDESARAVKEHLEECDGCKEACRAMKENTVPEIYDNKDKKKSESLKRVYDILHRKTTKKIIAAVCVSVAGALAVLFFVNSFMFTYPLLDAINNVSVEDGMLYLKAAGNPGQITYSATTTEGNGKGEPVLVITSNYTLSDLMTNPADTDTQYMPVFSYPLTQQAWEDNYKEDFERNVDDVMSHGSNMT